MASEIMRHQIHGIGDNHNSNSHQQSKNSHRNHQTQQQASRWSASCRPQVCDQARRQQQNRLSNQIPSSSAQSSCSTSTSVSKSRPFDGAAKTMTIRDKSKRQEGDRQEDSQENIEGLHGDDCEENEEANEEEEEEEGEEEEEDEDQNATGGNQMVSEDDPNKHHVGPVMGIFFKVWSLVKVTKMRHHQKMRRQNSEDASQFHYISGEQLGGQRHSSASPQVESGHLRRAGSQPAPSWQAADLHHSQQQQQQQQSGLAANRLQVAALSNGTATSGGTRSSASSCVSSSTSSTLASCDTQRPHCATESPRQKNRHRPGASFRAKLASAANMDNSSGPQQIAAAAAARSKNLLPTGSGSGSQKSGWASKIKRSTTSVSHRETVTASTPPAGSYMSRYRSKREQQQQQQSAQAQQQQQQQQQHQRPRLHPFINLSKGSAQEGKCSSVKAPAGGDPSRQVRAQSEACESAGRSEIALRRRQACSRDAISDEEDHYTANNDSDTNNDIYSTPNDSIQSVPNSAAPPTQADASSHPLSSFNLLHQQRCDDDLTPPAAPTDQQQQQRLHSMVKSLSTNNFGRLLQTSNQRQGGCSDAPAPRRRPLNGRNLSLEQTEESADSRGESHARPQKAVRPLLEAPEVNCSSSGGSGSGKGPMVASKRLNGSRFFISSSSSEDSNPPAHQQQQQHHHHHHLVNGIAAKSSNCAEQQIRMIRSTSMALEQHHPRIPLQFALHYHEPARPDSLLLGPSANNGLISDGGSGGGLLLPDRYVHLGSGIGVNGTPISLLDSTPSVAAMSPANGGHQLFVPTGGRQDAQTGGAVYLAPSTLANQHIGNLFVPAYRKSPSLFEMKSNAFVSAAALQQQQTHLLSSATRFSSRFPRQDELSSRNHQLSSFRQSQRQQILGGQTRGAPPGQQLPNSISLHDCKLTSRGALDDSHQQPSALNSHRVMLAGGGANNGDQIERHESVETCEYKLAQMLLELGSNPHAKDQSGSTALMHAILSDNLAALKCLTERGVDLDETNDAQQSALDLVCSKAASETRLEMLKILIDSGADLDRNRKSDGTRLLDRLISQHQVPGADKLAFIDCLLHNGAKLGSSTWLAASGKHEIQLRLLRKLCQDGYFLYKESSIEAAVYRFEYALKRIAELEQQLATGCCKLTTSASAAAKLHLDRETLREAQQIKYQTYLGLSRCERKRRFYKRALEFAHMSILVDSTAYEGYYSKAHILKDMGEIDDSLIAIDQTVRLVDKSIETIKSDLSELQLREDSIVFDGCLKMHEPNKDAKRHISRLRLEIQEDKLKLQSSTTVAQAQQSLKHENSLVQSP